MKTLAQKIDELPAKQKRWAIQQAKETGKPVRFFLETCVLPPIFVIDANGQTYEGMTEEEVLRADPRSILLT